jgi:hypothetical protein
VTVAAAVRDMDRLPATKAAGRAKYSNWKVGASDDLLLGCPGLTTEEAA